ncbi:poly-gamma-glutamate hydrolase family protein [Staphylococcus gallinarum]|uniref:Phage-related replication protein n=1 Tax=Staphylococcus gallinarum TaxID=1293 RepID=A0A418HPF5_STAGA|nr:poly-gamma-glutamate hydrolase family protein [Staphylococcus gallinarum]MCD8871390.1 poly-gamma-glutamate hydrolase family protein [Staphylococcus gallinarum]MCQ9288361.1 poly-gamma-glutamate hydrolase family protein [Staphylococcus gallinarum]MCW0986373.1 poly-gamma-glutamate hydrolase family protein [Staphylococcus gallinarum]MEB6242492.1 poly-gamma-glutamate hydrolase family protein [Staphylococcus gallinarum]MEB6295672.1 poly-gamma-glutamate hydrolase family protein [Staphylococcus gal
MAENTYFFKWFFKKELYIITFTCMFIYLLSVFSKPVYADSYASMTELMNDTEQGIDWNLSYDKRFGNTIIAAVHGGNIEPGTTELSKLIANNGFYNYYSFEGIRTTNNGDLHVTSTNYDEPTILDMQQQMTKSVMIHGASGSDSVVYIGGKDEPLKSSIKKQLELRGFNVQPPPRYLEGDSDANIANRNAKNAGVQLELSLGLRASFFNNGDLTRFSREDETNWSPIMHEFADAITVAILQN